MLEAIRKGFWEASPETVREIAKRQGELVEIYGAGSLTNTPDDVSVSADGRDFHFVERVLRKRVRIFDGDLQIVVAPA